MRTRTPLLVVLAGFALLLAAAPAAPHHAMVAQFSKDKPITLIGTLTRVEWLNPHAWIYLDVKRPDGGVENWAVETGSPYGMERRGLKRSNFQPGIEIIVGGYAAKDGSRTAAGMVITFAAREASGGEASFALGR